MTKLDTIKVAALPIDLHIGDKQANIQAASDMISRLAERPDIVVLPELFSTAYISDADEARQMAEPEDGPTIGALKDLAHTHGLAVCGSFLAIGPDGSLSNRAFFIEPGGDAYFYDKRHLFVISQEAKIAKAGSKPSPIIRFRGWNIAMAVCYDVRFPAWLRNDNLKYDLLIIPANWPDKRAYAWERLLQARAIENQAYVVGANRAGQDDFGCYDNLTYIFNYKGEPQGAADGSAVAATLSKAAMKKYREAFPVWKDADEFDIKY